MPDLSKKIITSLCILAEKYNISRVILFGSRARGDNRNTSDIDLAISGGDCKNFAVNIDDELDSLLRTDVIILDENVSAELRNIIKEEGIIIYEKI